jgi:hypothetical protein
MWTKQAHWVAFACHCPCQLFIEGCSLYLQKISCLFWITIVILKMHSVIVTVATLISLLEQALGLVTLLDIALKDCQVAKMLGFVSIKPALPK